MSSKAAHINGKMIIFTAPSGAGKTTIVRHLLKKFPELSFSISATNRPKRDYEIDGKDYYFLSDDKFRQWIRAGEFAEWEEVYEDNFYGTLKSEVRRIITQGQHVIFDIDVKGATSLKKRYPVDSLAIFIKPPSVKALLERITNRNTESPKSLKRRIRRAKMELSYESTFDRTLVNDNLETALEEAEELIRNFLYPKDEEE